LLVRLLPLNCGGQIRCETGDGDLGEEEEEEEERMMRSSSSCSPPPLEKPVEGIKARRRREIAMAAAMQQRSEGEDERIRSDGTSPSPWSH
jgi:hypothetical protein